MRFELKGPFRENIYNLMRKAGYHFQGQNTEEELAFNRPPRGFPRFHLFVKVKNDAIVFNLHLDQKAPNYKGVPAHAGEYDGEVVEKETERIKQILQENKN